MTWTLQQMDVVVTSVTLTINVPGCYTPKQCSVLVAGALRFLECSSWHWSTPSSSCSELGVQVGS